MKTLIKNLRNLELPEASTNLIFSSLYLTWLELQVDKIRHKYDKDKIPYTDDDYNYLNNLIKYSIGKIAIDHVNSTEDKNQHKSTNLTNMKECEKLGKYYINEINEYDYKLYEAFKQEIYKLNDEFYNDLASKITLYPDGYAKYRHNGSMLYNGKEINYQIAITTMSCEVKPLEVCIRINDIILLRGYVARDVLNKNINNVGEILKNIIYNSIKRKEKDMKKFK